MINYESRYSDELMHHGIKGQKWGDKNGPPYPLDKEEHMQVISSSKDKKRVAAGKDAKEAKRMARKERKAWRLQRKQFKKNAKKLEVEKKQTKKFIKQQEKLHKKEEKMEKFNKKAEAKFEKRQAEREARIAEREKKFQKGNEKLGNLSDDEIRQRLARLNLEKQYKETLAQARPKKNSAVAKILKESAGTALGTVATASLIFAGKEFMSRKFGIQDDMKNEDARKKFKEDLFRNTFMKSKK